jgi:hypothetical protein
VREELNDGPEDILWIAKRQASEFESVRLDGVEMADRLYTSKSGVLIVVPLSPLDHWKKEMQIRMHPPPKVLVYRMCGIGIVMRQFLTADLDGKATDECKTIKALQDVNIVITTYDTVRLEYEAYTAAKYERRQGKFPLLVVSWFLVVLDNTAPWRHCGSLLGQCSLEMHPAFCIVLGCNGISR